jgi:arginase
MGKRRAAILAVQMDLGAGRRGVDMGPSAIRLAGLSAAIEELGWRTVEHGSLTVREPEAVRAGRSNARYLGEVLDVCKRLHAAVREVHATGALPICLGGDHSIAMGSISATAAHQRELGQAIGVLWVDAHTDMNVPDTSPSGNIHGMPLSHLLGYGLPALARIGGHRPAVLGAHTALLGIRSVDRRERQLVARSGVRAYTMSEIDRRGIAACTEEALRLVSDGTAGFHLSFDLDAVDPRVAPGVGTPCQGGLTYREAHLVCEEAARTGALLAMDMVELNPILDEHNRTGRLAVELIASALGKRIL